MRLTTKTSSPAPRTFPLRSAAMRAPSLITAPLALVGGGDFFGGGGGGKQSSLKLLIKNSGKR